MSNEVTRPAWLDLLVVDLQKQKRFYQKLLGFEVLEESDDRVELGSRVRKLLGLQLGAKKLSDPGQAGLFHAAWLLPRRADLGAWLVASQAMGIPLDGAADHGVSEALYLTDPEGNGIEIYWDRPRGEWPFRSGKLAMGTEALNFSSLFDSASGQVWRGFPEEAELGHLHFQSPQSLPASRFTRSSDSRSLKTIQEPGLWPWTATITTSRSTSGGPVAPGTLRAPGCSGTVSGWILRRAS